MSSINRLKTINQNRISKQRLLEQINEKRETNCFVERSNQVSFLRVQKRHFSGAHQSCVFTHFKEGIPDSSRNSWVQPSVFVHPEKRHFEPKSKMLQENSYSS
ncbi:spermatogenesis-associated protein 45 [Urocitellus parryii]|uniref:Spermatosis associated 45 n=1 Tax=Urocitellus parryii TaxID=9999 RepID=A0A8D2KL29_UROPR|nr:spermatogenesis-associated protein 45 [Urocitellus parryii]